MTIETMRTLTVAETDLVAGGNNGVVAGPNGGGCTEPPIPTKPGLDLNTQQILFG